MSGRISSRLPRKNYLYGLVRHLDRLALQNILLPLDLDSEVILTSNRWCIPFGSDRFLIRYCTGLSRRTRRPRSERPGPGRWWLYRSEGASSGKAPLQPIYQSSISHLLMPKSLNEVFRAEIRTAERSVQPSPRPTPPLRFLRRLAARPAQFLKRHSDYVHK